MTWKRCLWIEDDGEACGGFWDDAVSGNHCLRSPFETDAERQSEVYRDIEALLAAHKDIE